MGEPMNHPVYDSRLATFDQRLTMFQAVCVTEEGIANLNLKLVQADNADDARSLRETIGTLRASIVRAGCR